MTKNKSIAAVERVTVVAVGASGRRIAASLADRHAAIEIVSEQMPPANLNRVLAESDLLFLVSGLENEAVVEHAAIIAAMCKRAGRCKAVVALIATSGVGVSDQAITGLQAAVDAIFPFTCACLATEVGGVSNLASDLAMEESLICTIVHDLAAKISGAPVMGVSCGDFRPILGVGRSTGRFGVGIGSARGDASMAQAAANALQALRGQGMEPSNFEGVLVSITAPANLSMADFESVTDQIIGAISEDCNYQVALSKDLPDEGMQVVVFASEVL